MKAQRLKYIKYFVLLFSIIVLEVNGSTWLYFYLGNFLKRTGNEHMAMDLYEKINRKEEVQQSNFLRKIFRFSSNQEYRANSLLLSFHADKQLILEQEATLIRFIYKLKSKDKQHYIKLYNLYRRQGLLSEAASIVAKYEKDFKKDFPAPLSEGLIWSYSLWVAYLSEGMLTKAEQIFKQCIAVDRNFADIYYRLGLIKFCQNKIKGAVDMYKKAVSLLPAHLDALMGLKDIYTMQNNQEKLQGINKRLSALLPPKKLDSNFSNRIQVLGYNIQMADEDRAEFSFWFKCIGSMDIDYEFKLRSYIRQTYLPHIRIMEGRYADFANQFDKKTSDWRIGEVYCYRYKKRILPGRYKFIISFYYKTDGREGWQKLKNILVNKNYVEINWMDLTYGNI